MTPLDKDMIETDLHKMDTTGSVLMTKELFEKLYLSPETKVAGQLRKTFANPTPVGLAGFLLALTPLSICLMGWGGSGNDGAATVGGLVFFGGMLAVLTAIAEFLLGNAFSMITFGVYGGFFLTYAATLIPWFNAYGSYDAFLDSDKLPDALAPHYPGFLASFAMILVCFAVFTFFMLLCSLRTNICHVMVFLCLDCSLACVAASNFYGSQDPAFLTKPITDSYNNFVYYRLVGGGFAFAASIFGWYELLCLMLASVDFPIQLPVGDLSRIIRGHSERYGDKIAAQNGGHGV